MIKEVESVLLLLRDFLNFYFSTFAAAVLWITVYSFAHRTPADVPVCVQTGDGRLPVTVQVLRLLQEDVVEDSGDVDGDVVLYGLEHRHVGSDAGQQLTGLGYLLSSLVVHGHPHYGPGDRWR